MTLYRCSEDWEHNKYDDSDWYCVAYCDESKKLCRVEVGSTRWANGTNHGGGVVPMTPEILPLALEALVAMYESHLTHLERRRVEEPAIDALTSGTEVRLLEAHRCMHKDKERVVDTCHKCGGSGKWQNPRRATDTRPCFGCGGTSKVESSRFVKAKDEAGKPVWEDIDAGAVGTVLNQVTYGRFYRNGYNKPGRNNTTVYLRLADGREVQVPAKKLRLNKEPPSAKAIHEYAVQSSKEPNCFYAMFRTSGISLV